ncbi:hypothetical protein M409DRAFT_15788 [Zasmidium cellare ATCC 36951]|uniref:Elongin-A n=1 Tax=Zasmidium cellare ATCC 36951 TaxID=1080233 RepID=A0A6A6D520_ZASCE|nr:uncharacterized protein M409DRAFT_15788 [Zasmidium cellare ATCC 36951]KAF2173508.1 hypothetical protein M409DRAFT_15788 [Zasmidium cellare ATCC 36951]
MPATTLFKMAMQAAIRLSAQINDIADMPYELARPILLKIQSPQQLRDIEINCPHIAEADKELWVHFIQRDIPDWESKIVEPKNKNSWHKVYRWLQRKEERKAAEDEEALRKTLAGEGVKKAEKNALFIDKVLPHARAEDEHNFYIDGVKNKNLNASGSDKRKPPTMKNAKTGRDMLGAIRRQAVETSRARSMVKPFAPPTASQRLDNAKRQITQAPASMIQSAIASRPLTIAPREPLPHEKAMMKEMNRMRATTKIQPPTRMANIKFAEQNKQAIEAATRKAREVNEAKLRALTQVQKRPSTASSPPSKAYDFAPSPIVVDPSKRASPPIMTAAPPARVQTPAASPPAASAPPPPKQPVAISPDSTPKTSASQAKSISPESSPPPKMMKKRPAPTSIFMNTNKKRKI